MNESSGRRPIRFALLVCAAALACAINSRVASAQTPAQPDAAGEAEWIWSPAHTKDLVPAGDCFFRRTFDVAPSGQPRPASGFIQITCDDRYELYFNGQLAGSGDNWRTMRTHDLTRRIVPGRNVIAVKVTNTTGKSAGLAARVKIALAAGTEESHASDPQWKTSLKEAPGWQSPGFDDSQWIPARSFGPFGSTPPWSGQVAVDAGDGGRFLVAPEFRVEQVLSGEQTGPLLALAFNEWGEIIASRENGPLLLISDDNRDGTPETVNTYSDLVKGCQGILALNGHLFVVGDGPQGTALYKISGEDDEPGAEMATALIEFEGSMGEHGPHAPVLGPDGFIYVIVGNHSAPKEPYDPASPHHDYYEGDLVQPRYEDAGGHAVGIKAPGGVVLRTRADGGQVQAFAGGFRNPYDIAFNKQGDLFTYDADMEWDLGLPWYRPTRVNHVVAGGEYGWRSGWSKWPAWYLDSLPPALETGRGSPTGVEFYNHYRFPVRYHNALFACDWSQGRIVSIKLKPSGGTYAAEGEVFLEGRPLNATDLAVGPDGWLYFATGGRGTEGGIYRIVWTGKVPPRPRLQGVMEAIRQPQLQSAWARQSVAGVQQALGAEWDRQLTAVVENTAMSVDDRTRALDLMQLLGPFPGTQLLVRLTYEPHVEVRAKAAWLLGIHADPAAGARLIELLVDPDPTVRRVACESLVRGGYQPPTSSLIGLLADPHRYVAWSAGRALQNLPTAQWEQQVLRSENIRVFLAGSAALVAMRPPDATIDAIITRSSHAMRGYLSDDDFVDLLRLLELALGAGRLVRDNVPELCRQLADEYPANEPPGREQRINRELVRLLVHLQEPSVISRLIDVLQSDAPAPEKLHVATHAGLLRDGWTDREKLALVQFYEQARLLPGGHSFAGYVENCLRDFVAHMTDDERRQVLDHASRWPTAALFAIATLSEDLDADMVARLIDLDRQLPASDDPATQRLATGVVAVLGRSGDAQAMAHLRDCYERDPERRQELAMGLSQSPAAENWPVLLQSLAIVEGVAAQEVLRQLAAVEEAPDEPEPIRQVILCGLKLGQDGAPLASKLLARWTGEQVVQPDDTWQVAMAAWQEWFQEKYPHEPAPVLPVEAAEARWSYDELLGFLNGPEASAADSRRGAAVFAKAQCIKCHRYGNRGEGIGPDLSTVSQRFQKKEILEAVIFPSHVISDQYASKTVTTTGGLVYTGIVAPAGGDAVVVLQANGEKVTVAAADVESTTPAASSAMPEGLFDSLTLAEIADLFAYLASPPRVPVLSREPGTSARE